jgi:nicotinamidase-related amidase
VWYSSSETVTEYKFQQKKLDIMSISLCIIDPQKDFMDLPESALKVKGAAQDMDNVAAFVEKHGSKIDHIRITLDSHHPIHIAHPVYWMDKGGKSPDPITVTAAEGRLTDAIISLDKVEGTNPQWRTRNPNWGEHGINYVRSLEGKGYPLTIWPYHCLIGSDGATIYEPLQKALTEWELKEFGCLDIVTKGSNLHTEHYGAVKAEFDELDDDTVKTNASFAELIDTYDINLFAGEAGSHCLGRTVGQIGEEFGDDYLKKITLLTDGTSPVEFCEQLQTDFIDASVAKGMQLSDTKSFF